MTLTKEQFVKNSGWTLAELSLFPVLVIIATPVFISKLGIEQYGLWVLVVTVTQIVNILNIGIGDTVIRLIAQYRAEQNDLLISKVFRYSFSLSLFLFFISVLVGAILSSVNFISLFYQTNNYSFANTILFISTAFWGIKFIEIAILSFFKAFERFDLNSKLSLISKNSVIVANLIMISMGYDLITTLFVALMISFLNIFIQLIVLHKFRKNTLVLPNFDFIKERSEYMSYNFWYWLQSSIALIGFLTDKLAVAWLTDIKTLGYYYIGSMIAANIHNFFLAFGSFVFPRVSFKLASKTDLTPLYMLSRALIALPGWLLIGFLIVGGDFIFKFWLGNETYLQSIYFIKLYLVFEAGMLLIIVPFHFVNGTSKLKLNSIFEAIIRTSHFVAMLIGYYFGGVNGIVYGLIISTMLNIPFQYYYFHQKIITGMAKLDFLFVIIPVLCLLGILLSGNPVFQFIFILAFLLSSKLIYFDRGKQYTNKLFFGEKA